MEFLGTKGEWSVKDNYIIDENGSILSEVHLTTDTNEYDLLLMSKAPNLLNELKSIIFILEYSNINKDEVIKRIHNVILDATQIK